MIKVALTGNIGSGKSTVAHIFSSLGIPVFHADDEAKQLYREPLIKSAVANTFGKEVMDKQQEVDFKKLAAIIFSDDQALKKINEIIHPGVFSRYRAWLNKHKEAAYTLHEAAVIFENKLEDHFDFIIQVSAPEDVRLNRVVSRDGISPEQFYARAKKQWNEEDKNIKSDYVIVNNGKLFLIPQVMEIHQKLLTMPLP